MPIYGQVGCLGQQLPRHGEKKERFAGGEEERQQWSGVEEDELGSRVEEGRQYSVKRGRKRGKQRRG